jgi:hypothetical protein
MTPARISLLYHLLAEEFQEKGASKTKTKVASDCLKATITNTNSFFIYQHIIIVKGDTL